MTEKDDISIAKSVMHTEAQCILDASQRVGTSFQKAIDILDVSRAKVIITGIGKSGHLGKKISATLCSTGTPACYLHPSEAVHGDLGIHQVGDPVIFLSNSGSTPELISLEPVLRKRSTKIVGILGNPNSKLADMVDAVLDASVTKEADPLGMVPTASFSVASSIGDAIASALMIRKGFSEKDYAITHPAGQLGKNLTLNVSDVMHKPNKIACVHENTSVRDVVLEMTTFPLGAACVFNQQEQLVGVITDGDLRRGLKNFDNINEVEASKIMSLNPVTVLPNVSLGTALKVMEEGKSQISVLPVTNEDTEGIFGLVRLHDIYDPNVG